MVSCIGSDMGKVAIAGDDAVTNQQINSIIVGREFCTEFVYYDLSTRKDEFQQLASGGSAQPILNKGLFSSLPISVPTITEQRAIARVLGALDDKIELNRRLNRSLEELAQAVFRSWFVDFDPVTAKASGRQPIALDPATADLFPNQFQDSELGLIPKGWSVARLADHIDYREGPGLRNWQYTSDGMKFLNIRCISDGDIDTHVANYISLDEFHKKYEHFALAADDIVLSTSGTLGRSAIVRDDHLPVMLNTSIIRFRGKGEMGLAFVWNFLRSTYFLDEMLASATGSVQLNFGPMHLERIVFVRPSDRLLREFESRCQPIIRKTLKLRQQSKTLTAARDALLPPLLSGELRVPDAERFVERMT